MNNTLYNNLKKEINLNHKLIQKIINYIEENFESIKYEPKGTLFTKEGDILQNINFVVNNKYILDINIVFDFIRIYTKTNNNIELIYGSSLIIMNNNLKGILKSIKNNL